MMSGQSLFQAGSFRSHSGEVLPWKIECDVLRPADWDCLALMLRMKIGPFGEVEGVPKGGIAFANALLPHCTLGYPLLIVDDVLTTGGSMETLRDGRRAMGAVVFSRGASPGWITPIFRTWR